MGACNATKGRKVEFSKLDFEPFQLVLSDATLTFESKGSKFVDIKNPFKNPVPENPNLNNELDIARIDVEKKKERIEKLKKSISDLEKNHSQLMKILNVDFNEKDYIERLITKHNENKETAVREGNDHEEVSDDEFIVAN